MWPDCRLLELLGTELPIIQAPMAGANGSALAAAVSETGGLGSLPCAMLDAAKARAEIGVIRQRTAKPLNVNFFCHQAPQPDAARDAAWRERLAGYYRELDLDPTAEAPAVNRAPFDESMCALVEDLRPAVVSFHFGLPEPALLSRVKAAGCKVLSSATTVAEACWLEDHGCDAVIAQGFEAGGHRGMFLTDKVASQVGTMALVPQVVDAVNVPVIAAGGIGDGRGIAAAFALGAAGVQLGTAYLFTPESLINDLHRAALHSAGDDKTALTNLFSGRPARGLGQPADARSRAAVRAGAGLSHCWRRAGAAQGQGRGQRVGRFFFAVVGPGGRPGQGGRCRRANPDAGPGGTPKAGKTG